jgi:hypothetical protein
MRKSLQGDGSHSLDAFKGNVKSKNFINLPKLTSLKNSKALNNLSNRPIDANQLEPIETINSESRGQIKETVIENENGDVITISEFTVTPNTANKIYSNSYPKSVLSKSNSNSNTETAAIYQKRATIVNISDEFHNQYMKETSKWRLIRANLGLPTIRNQSVFKRLSNIDLLMKFKQDKNESLSESFEKTYEPNYRLQPKVKFDRRKAEDIINKVLKNFIENMFNPLLMSSKTDVKSFIEHLSTTIKTKVKAETIEHDKANQRYKIIVNCTIAEQKYQGLTVALKCLWDTENDICVSIREVHKNYVFLVDLFAIYQE